MRIAVVGGGFTGLVLALRLGLAGHSVTLFEHSSQVGGLATWHDYGGLFHWDRFYHVILPQDTHLLGLIEQLGLSESLVWSKPQTGLYAGGKLYPFTTPTDLLRFPLFSVFEKLRLGLGTAWAARIADPEPLRGISLEAWLVPIFGRNVFENFWKPLLLAKLGESWRETSAFFLWTYLRRLYAARSGAGKRESLGHVSGGYRMILQALAHRIEEAGGRILCDSPVRQIVPLPDGTVTITTPGEILSYDRVCFTGPEAALRAATPEGFLPARAETSYLGVVCLALVTRSPLVPFYVTNLAAPEVPFTGIVCTSNVVPAEHTSGYYLTYFPKYVPMNHPLLDQPWADVKALFLDGVKALFPAFPEAHVVSSYLQTARRVQPLPTIGKTLVAPPLATPHPSLFLVNTAQFTTGTLNNNSVVEHVDSVLPALLQ